MKLSFLNTTLEERRLYFEEAARQRDLSPVLLEKDFWVCWLLGVLFSSEFAAHIVFKGGTSLSKVFGVIGRFSEDIDLSISPEFLALPQPRSGRNQADKWMKNAESACATSVQRHIRPTLESAVAAVLGERDGGWFESLRDPVTQSPVLLFCYPTIAPAGFEYLTRSVKLEFGSLTEQRPVGRHAIRPWLAEVFETAFPDWVCDVVALELERTFWEKATILHAEFHRPGDRPTPDRFSRHYADTAAFSRHPIAVNVTRDHQLCDRVVAWKAQFFGSTWARYDLAKPGSFRLVPRTEQMRALRRDYYDMRDMYLAEPPSFDDILDALAELERNINQQAKE